MSKILVLEAWTGAVGRSNVTLRPGEIVETLNYGVTADAFRASGAPVVDYVAEYDPAVAAFNESPRDSMAAIFGAYGFFGGAIPFDPVGPGDGAVEVRSVDDLPDAIAGEITLDPDTTYYVVGTISLDPGDCIVMSSGTNIMGRRGAADAIEGNCAGPVLLYDNNSPSRTCRVEELTIRNTSVDPAAHSFSFSGTGANFNGAFLSFAGPVDIGTCNSFVFQSGLFSPGIAAPGVHVTGTVRTVTLSSYAVFLAGTNTSGVRLDATASIEVLTSDNSTMVFSDASQSGFSVDAAATVDSGRLFRPNFVGAPGTPTDGFDEETPGWRITDSPVIPDSATGGGSSLTTSPLVVPTTTTNQWEDVSDGVTSAHTLGSGSERFELVSALTGEVRFIGTRETRFHLSGGASLIKAGGSDFIAECAMFVNDVLVAGTSASINAGTRLGSVATIPAIVALNPNDTVKLKIRNTENTGSTSVRSAGLSVAPL